MQPLFSTELTHNNQPVLYNIVFENNHYQFNPDNTNGEAKTFSLIREHDEWKTDGHIDESLADEAIDKLETYLLAQL